MGLSEDDVLQILKYLADSSFDELHLEMGDLKIHVNKRASPDSIDTGQRESSETESGETTSAERAGSLRTQDTALDAVIENQDHSISGASQETREVPQSIDQEVVVEGLLPIKSPMLGTFYQAPKPGGPPFVEVGAVVDEETTVCLIEVMKLFTTIKAGTRGRITRVRAEDGQLVEYNQVLFWVDLNVDPNVDSTMDPLGA